MTADPSADAPAPLSPLEILRDDPPVLVVNKPAGLLTLGAKPGVATLERQVKEYLKARFQKAGNVYLGIPHRLDRPVSGVILFARNSKGAARLAEQFRERQVRKVYWAVAEVPLSPPDGSLTDWLLKTTDQAHVQVVAEGTPGAREATLQYRTLAQNGHGVLLEIELGTGRMHQIRVQLAARVSPSVGDVQYGASRLLLETPPADPTQNPIALHAGSLTFLHPVRYDSVTVSAPLPANWARLDFGGYGPSRAATAPEDWL